MSYIPVLDLADYLSGDEARRQKFIQGFGKAYSEIGFAFYTYPILVGAFFLGQLIGAKINFKEA